MATETTDLPHLFNLDFLIFFYRSSENFYTSLVDIQTSHPIYDDVYSEGSQSSYSGSDISQASRDNRVSENELVTPTNNKNNKQSSSFQDSKTTHVQQRTTSEVSVSGGDTNSSSKTILGSDPEYGLPTVPLFVAVAASRFMNAARNKTMAGTNRLQALLPILRQQKDTDVENQADPSEINSEQSNTVSEYERVKAKYKKDTGEVETTVKPPRRNITQNLMMSAEQYAEKNNDGTTSGDLLGTGHARNVVHEPSIANTGQFQNGPYQVTKNTISVTKSSSHKIPRGKNTDQLNCQKTMDDVPVNNSNSSNMADRVAVVNEGVLTRNMLTRSQTTPKQQQQQQQTKSDSSVDKKQRKKNVKKKEHENETKKPKPGNGSKPEKKNGKNRKKSGKTGTARANPDQDTTDLSTSNKEDTNHASKPENHVPEPEDHVQKPENYIPKPGPDNKVTTETEIEANAVKPTSSNFARALMVKAAGLITSSIRFSTNNNKTKENEASNGDANTVKVQDNDVGSRIVAGPTLPQKQAPVKPKRANLAKLILKKAEEMEKQG